MQFVHCFLTNLLLLMESFYIKQKKDNYNKTCILIPSVFFSFSFDPQKIPKFPKLPTPKCFMQISSRSRNLYFRCHYYNAILQTRKGLHMHLNSFQPRHYYCQYCNCPHTQLRHVIIHERQQIFQNFMFREVILPPTMQTPLVATHEIC